MKKFTMISLLLFMLFYNIVPAFAESYIVQVPVSYTGPSGSTRIIFTNQETKHQSSYTIDRQTKVLSFTYTSLGTYHYTVTKEAGEDTNTHYDDRTYQVIISLTRTNNDVIRKSIIVYLASDLTKLSKITYTDHRQAAAMDRDSNQANTQNQAAVHDRRQTNTQQQAINKDKKAKAKSQSSKASGTKKNAKGQKAKAKNQAAKASAAKKKNKTDSGSKSSASSGKDGTDSSNMGENDDHSSAASASDAAYGKNKQMHNSQEATSTQNQSAQNEGVIHTGDTTTFVQWMILMMGSLIGMVMMKKRKG